MSEDIEKEGKQVPSIRKSEEAVGNTSAERISRTNTGVEMDSEEEREVAGGEEEK